MPFWRPAANCWKHHDVNAVRSAHTTLKPARTERADPGQTMAPADRLVAVCRRLLYRLGQTRAARHLQSRRGAARADLRAAAAAADPLARSAVAEFHRHPAVSRRQFAVGRRRRQRAAAESSESRAVSARLVLRAELSGAHAGVAAGADDAAAAGAGRRV